MVSCGGFMPELYNNYTILLVEDELLIALNEQSGLEELGHRVICAHGREEALRCIDVNSEIDLILMDVDLGPGPDGIDTASEILQKRHIPVIFLSSHDEDTIVKKAIDVSPYGYIAKSSGINMINTSIMIAMNLFSQKMDLRTADRRPEPAGPEPDGNAGIIKDQEKVAADAEKKFKDLFEMTPDCVFVHDRSWRLLYYHVPKDSVFPEDFNAKIGCHLREILKDDHNSFLPDKIIDMVNSFEVGEKSKSIEFENILGNRKYFFEVRVFLTEERIYVIVRNITERKIAELKVAENEKKYRIYMENFPGIAFKVVSGEGIIFIHGAVEKITGYSETDLLSGNVKHSDIIFPTDFESFKKAIDIITKNPGLSHEYEHRIVRKDGLCRWVHVNAQSMRDENSSLVHIQGVIIDITERKEMEESLQNSKTMLSQTEKLSKTGSFSIDLDTVTYSWSDEMYQIMNRDKSLGPLDTDSILEKYVFREEDRKRASELYRQTVENGMAMNEVYEINIDGFTKFLDIRAFPKRDESGKITAIFGYFQDITRIKTAEDALKKALRTNRELLQELQHRAKNSFSMVYSMIRLTAHSETDNNLKDKLLEVANRIRAVSEMYDLLYQTGSVERIELHNYIKRVSSSVPLPSGRIKVMDRLESVTVPVKIAIPIGIIIVELMTNSIKHAFNGKDEGIIEIAMSMGDESLDITVSDNGTGIEKGLEAGSEKSLGLKLVRALVDTIRGGMNISSPGGTIAVITVPASELNSL